MKIPSKRYPIEQVLWLLILGQSVTCDDLTGSDKKNSKRLSSSSSLEKDFRWPQSQLNVLVDNKSINETERQILGAFFDQIQHKTCLKINQLSPFTVNPFDTRHFQESDRNFIYIFKAQLGLAHTNHPPLGLSTFGCVRQGRQSMVLGDLAFRWPELVLKYHLLRSLAVANLTRPEEEVRRRLNVLPMSQKIGDADEVKRNPGTFDPAPLFTYATFAGLADKNLQVNKKRAYQKPEASPEQPAAVIPVEYLNEQELKAIKDLYNCSDLSNRLSTKPLDEIGGGGTKQSKQLVDLYNSEVVSSGPSNPTESANTLASSDGLNSSLLETTTLADSDTERDKQTDIIDQKINDTLVDDAAKSIMNQLISETQTDNINNPQESRGSRSDDDDDNEEPTTTSSTIVTPFPEQTGPGSQCRPLESCTLDGYQQDSGGVDGQTPASESIGGGQNNKPMMMQLDDFHAQDPHLQQADQMKLSQLNNSSPNFQTYRLMNADLTPQQEQQPQQFKLPSSEPSKGKTEMLISFEQSQPGQQQNRDPIGALASSQVLKLCSCTCQTMAPVNPPPNPLPQPLPSTPSTPVVVSPTTSGLDPFEPTTERSTTERSITERPTTDMFATERPTTERSTTERSSTERSTSDRTSTHLPPITEPSEEQTSDTTKRLTTTTFMPTKRPTTTESFTFPTTTSYPLEVSTFPPWTTDIAPEISTTTNATKSTTTSDEAFTQPWTQSPFTDTDGLTEPPHTAPTVSTTSQGGSLADNPCDQVQWVKPNKTVYASARIVWDVDRANQNYFLCNNQIKDEQVPGKTHGFSCKVGNEGHAYELHNFNVLTKPESVNLAWIQRNSGTLGKKNLPVIGGYSKNQDPLVVSRCMVRDENNDVITLIGYINSSGIGLFPFDDIQIECSQYDVLACVS